MLTLLQLFAPSAMNNGGGVDNGNAGASSSDRNQEEASCNKSELGVTVRGGDGVPSRNVLMIEGSDRNGASLTIADIDAHQLISPVNHTEGGDNAGTLIVSMRDAADQAMSESGTSPTHRFPIQYVCMVMTCSVICGRKSRI